MHKTKRNHVNAILCMQSQRRKKSRETKTGSCQWESLCQTHFYAHICFCQVRWMDDTLEELAVWEEEEEEGGKLLAQQGL